MILPGSFSQRDQLLLCVIALHLMRGSGRSPQESFREMICGIEIGHVTLQI